MRRRIEIAGACLLAIWVSLPFVLPPLSLLPGLAVLDIYAGHNGVRVYLVWMCALLGVLVCRRQIFATLLTFPKKH